MQVFSPSPSTLPAPPALAWIDWASSTKATPPGDDTPLRAARVTLWA